MKKLTIILLVMLLTLLLVTLEYGCVAPSAPPVPPKPTTPPVPQPSPAPVPSPPTMPTPTPTPAPPSPPATAEDVQAALKTLGLSEEKLFFEGYLREADIITFYLTQEESCCLIQDSEGYGVETWFFLAGENIEDISKADEYLREYELPDYQWEELADSLLSAEVIISPDVTEVVPSEELEEKCAEIKKQLTELEKKLEQMKQKRRELEDLLSGAKEEKEKLEAQMADLEDKKANCPNDIAALQEEIPVLEDRVENMKEALKQSVWLWQECKSRHPSAPHRCNGYLDRVGLVYQKLQDLKRELAAKREALNSLQQECVELDSRIHLSISPKIGELNSAIRKYEQDIEDLSSQISELESKIKQIKERFRECLDELEEARKLEKQVEAARRKAGHGVDKAEEKIKELEERYKKLKERFPDGVYPEDGEKYREKIEEIKQKIEKSASELDEDKIDKARGSANDLAREVEREKARLGRYGLANICLEDCYKAYQLCWKSVENRRDTCGLSGHFKEAEEALRKLRECCDRAREELSKGNVQEARTISYGCLHKPNLAQAVYDALKKACTDRLVISYLDVPRDEEDLEGIRELVDFEVNTGLQLLGELGKIPSAILQAFEAGKITADQQKNACCLLMMMKFMLTSRSYCEAAVYAYGFVHFWHEISGLPEMPTASTAAALGLARIVENIPQETRDAAVSAINAVLRSARCAGVRCY